MSRNRSEALRDIITKISSGNLSKILSSAERLFSDKTNSTEILKALAALVKSLRDEATIQVPPENIHKLTELCCKTVFAGQIDISAHKENYINLALIIESLLQMEEMNLAWDLCQFFIKKGVCTQEVESNLTLFCFMLLRKNLSSDAISIWISRFSRVTFKCPTATTPILGLALSNMKKVQNALEADMFMTDLAKSSKSFALDVRGAGSVIKLISLFTRVSDNSHIAITLMNSFSYTNLEFLKAAYTIHQKIVTLEPIDFVSLLQHTTPLVIGDDLNHLFTSAAAILYKAAIIIRKKEAEFDVANFMEACNYVHEICFEHCTRLKDEHFLLSHGKLVIKMIIDTVFASLYAFKTACTNDSIMFLMSPLTTAVQQFLVMPVEDSTSDLDCGSRQILSCIKHVKKIRGKPAAFHLSLQTVGQAFFAMTKKHPAGIEKFQRLIDTLLEMAFECCEKEVECYAFFAVIITLADLPIKLTTHNPFIFWASTKEKHPFTSEITITDVVKYRQTLDVVQWTQVHLENLELQNVVILELMSYSEVRDAKEAAKICYREVFKHVEDSWLLAVAVCSASCCFSSQVNEEVSDAVKSCQLSLVNFETSNLDFPDMELHYLIHGCLRFASGRCKLYQLMEDSLNEVLELTYEGDPHSMNFPIFMTDGSVSESVCVGPYMFKSLEYNNFSSIIQTFKDALRLWNKALTNEVITVVGQGIVLFVLSLLNSMGYLLRMFKYREMELSVWQLIISLAQKHRIANYVIIGVSELMDTCRVRVDQSLIKLVLDTFGTDPYYKSTSHVHNFYLCLYKYNKVFLKIPGVMKNLDDLVSTSKLFLARKNMVLSMNSADPRGIQQATAVIAAFIADSEWRSFTEMCLIMSLFFECCTMCGVLFNNSKDITKHYLTKKHLKVAHTMGCAFRTCETIACMLDMYLTTVELDECIGYMKIMEYILQVPRKIEGAEVQGAHCSNLLKTHCLCNTCTDVAYVEMVLRFITLKAFYHTLSNKVSEAVLAYQDGTCLVDKLRCLYKKQPFLVKDSHIVVRFYITGAASLMHWKKQDKAKRYIKKAELLLADLSYHGGLDINVSVEKLNLVMNSIPEAVICNFVERFPEAGQQLEYVIVHTPDSDVATATPTETSSSEESEKQKKKLTETNLNEEESSEESLEKSPRRSKKTLFKNEGSENKENDKDEDINGVYPLPEELPLVVKGPKKMKRRLPQQRKKNSFKGKPAAVNNSVSDNTNAEGGLAHESEDEPSHNDKDIIQGTPPEAQKKPTLNAAPVKKGRNNAVTTAANTAPCKKKDGNKLPTPLDTSNVKKKGATAASSKANSKKTRSTETTVPAEVAVVQNVEARLAAPEVAQNPKKGKQAVAKSSKRPGKKGKK